MTKSEMDSYQHNPIEDTESSDGIRLIYLLPGKVDDEIRCELTHVFFLTHPFMMQCRISVETPPTRCLLCVTMPVLTQRETYTTFFGRFVIPPRQSPCGQTPYALTKATWLKGTLRCSGCAASTPKAQRVLIWLGVADSGSDDAIRLVKRLKGCDVHTQNPLLSFTGAGIAPSSDPVWGFLADIFNRPYFQRVWVVQEVALSQPATVLCGLLSVSWEDLIHSAFYIHTAGVSRLWGRVRLNEITNIEAARRDHSRSITRSPLSLLLRQRDCIAADPRDKVFALYGMSEAAFHELRLDPDYRLKTADLYRDAAVRMLEKSSNLDVLGVPRSLQPLASLGEKLPSWVPDWSRNGAAISLLQLERDGIPFKAAGESKSSPTFDSDHCRLGLEGYNTGVIEAVSLTLSDSDPSNCRAGWYNIEAASIIIHNTTYAIPLCGLRYPTPLNENLPRRERPYGRILDNTTSRVFS